MKKLIALLMVCGFALAFVACGEKKAAETEEQTETTATEPAADSTTTPADSTQDSTQNQ